MSPPSLDDQGRPHGLPDLPVPPRDDLPLHRLVEREAPEEVLFELALLGLPILQGRHGHPLPLLLQSIVVLAAEAELGGEREGLSLEGIDDRAGPFAAIAWCRRSPRRLPGGLSGLLPAEQPVQETHDPPSRSRPYPLRGRRSAASHRSYTGQSPHSG